MARLNSKADSLVRMIKSGQDFGALAARYSDDPGSKSNGGVYMNSSHKGKWYNHLMISVSKENWNYRFS